MQVWNNLKFGNLWDSSPKTYCYMWNENFDNFNHAMFNFYLKVLLAFCEACGLDSRRKWNLKNTASHQV